jgi:hypothetical protein
VSQSEQYDTKLRISSVNQEIYRLEHDLLQTKNSLINESVGRDENQWLSNQRTELINKKNYLSNQLENNKREINKYTNKSSLDGNALDIRPLSDQKSNSPLRNRSFSGTRSLGSTLKHFRGVGQT